MGKAPQTNGRRVTTVTENATGGYNSDPGSGAGRTGKDGGLQYAGGDQGAGDARNIGDISKDMFGSMNGKQAGVEKDNGGVDINPHAVAYQKHDDHIYKN